MRKALLLLAIFGFVGWLWGADPFVGTWKLNVAKSKYSPGSAPKSDQAKIEALDNGVKHTFDTVEASGRTSHTEWSAKFDGKDYPVNGDPNADSGALKRIDANTIEVSFKKAGKEVGKWWVTVSKDGKTLTATATGTGVVEVYEKQ